MISCRCCVCRQRLFLLLSELATALRESTALVFRESVAPRIPDISDLRSPCTRGRSNHAARARGYTTLLIGLVAVCRVWWCALCAGATPSLSCHPPPTKWRRLVPPCLAGGAQKRRGSLRCARTWRRGRRTRRLSALRAVRNTLRAVRMRAPKSTAIPLTIGTSARGMTA